VTAGPTISRIGGVVKGQSRILGAIALSQSLLYGLRVIALSRPNRGLPGLSLSPFHNPVSGGEAPQVPAVRVDTVE
jgi:hypothetical protein